MASILVIDDDRAVLTTIKILLERAGHAIEVVDNSRAGLRLLESQSFDLLIVDLFMPGMDGFETMRLVRQIRPEMPIIVVSGNQSLSAPEGAPDFLYMATKLGAVSSVQKPFRQRSPHRRCRQPVRFAGTVAVCRSNAGKQLISAHRPAMALDQMR